MRLIEIRSPKAEGHLTTTTEVEDFPSFSETTGFSAN
jgi:hypothetical protein